MPSAALIQTRGLRKTYHSGQLKVEALRGVDLSLNRGEFLAIMGPSGSGKSTLMHILGCMDRPTAGSFRLEGRETSKLDDDGLSDLRNRSIGFIFQNFNLLPRMTALENVRLPLLYSNLDEAARSGLAETALERVGLGGRMDHRPTQLSGGQQQRVAVARALVMRPSLIVADEPTGNLDSKAAADIMGLFQSLNDEGNTLMIVTHDPGMAACCGRRLVLRDGRVTEDRKQRRKKPGRVK
jgi:putative ABC transport system ATP-binding protein